MKNRIKVILVDDHAVVRAGFRMLLSTEDTIEVIAEAERGEASLSAVSGKTAGCDGDGFIHARHRRPGKHSACLQS